MPEISAPLEELRALLADATDPDVQADLRAQIARVFVQAVRHPGTLPNPQKRVYTVDNGAIERPHRPLHVERSRQLELPHEPRAPFLPGVTELPVQTAEEQLATVRQDVAGRMQELEEMLDNAELAEPTRATILAEISRLRELTP